MKYKDCMAYLYNSLPMYQRIGAAAYKADLSTTIAMMEEMGNPQHAFQVVHVAGTNGKGSVSHLLASILQEAGFRVGLYTSPHLKSFQERIRINGKAISPYYVTHFVETYKERFDKLKPSFFEMTFAMAMHYFERKKVDIAVVETGMGGRLDSTNVVRPMVSVITNVSYDHMQFLGKTIPEIAREKAGIIKEGVPVIIGETDPESAPVFEAVAKEKNAPIIFADQVYRIEEAVQTSIRRKPCMIFNIRKNDKVFMGHVISYLCGSYQLKNFPTVAAVYEQIFSDVVMPIYTFKHVVSQVERTGLQGRWQQLRVRPRCIADTGHNEAGIRYVVEQLKTMSYKKLHIVLGVVADKDLERILPLFPTNAVYYFTRARIPRALPAEELQAKAAEYGLKGKVYPSVKNAYRSAVANAESRDLVFVGGSTFVVAEVL
ncbi:MAG: bifunctional folylpolyglutamate synthase/dihydrofolate synthase [Bacteroidales bacterium]|nr:bifunctional folylpolyglutamate synthase/dihydrofolate synthase [Bacteroidales bacterium]